ncbi:hypothetical protein OC844_005771 [Tilletia horrida]|nr:hypothetical protein OC844_005771 [Tilletia horrida]
MLALLKIWATAFLVATLAISTAQLGDAKFPRLYSQQAAKDIVRNHRNSIAGAAGETLPTLDRAAPLGPTSTDSLTLELHRRIIQARPELADAMSQLSGITHKPSVPALKHSRAVSAEAADFAPSVEAPKDNVWEPLSNDEAASVIKYLHQHLNVTQANKAGSWDNTISNVDIVPPNKTVAVSYLDGSAPRPLRWARATIMFGASDAPYIQDFAVGPLPITDNATHWSLDYLTTSGKNRIINSLPDANLLFEWLHNITISIADVTQALLGDFPFVAGPQDPQLTELKPGLNGTMERRFIRWVTIYRTLQAGFPFDMGTLLPQGLFFKIDITGRDPSKWSVDGWLYNNFFYNDIQAFRTAIQKPDFTKIRPLNLPGTQGSTDRAGEPLKYDQRVGPLTIYPEGRRFAVDHKRRYVEWGGFSFFIGFTRDAGLQLYNIRFNGERIVYHMGLQEAVAHYAGQDPYTSNTAYLDSFFGLGAYAYELVDGYDCPHGSTYMNTTFHSDEYSQTRLNSICLFEQDAHLPMQRHSSDAYVEVTKNIQLVLRSVSTVGNYDYTFSYIFSLDGSIETKVSASGYIQAAHFANNDEYGYRIHDALSGSMHDHVLNFKVDIDIKGTKNTFARHGAVAVQATYPWFNGTRSTMKLDKSWVLNEDEGRLQWPYNGQTQYLILNKDQTNKYGEHPGYRIMPGVGGGHHLSFPYSESLKNSAGFAREHLFVTKQKDTEVWSAHANNNYDTENPIINFDKYLDGESLEQEDLVLWVNLGMTHIPHTGDLPTTVQTTAQSSFLLTPHNYHLSDPSRRTYQQVRISYGAWQNDTTKLETFGQDGPGGVPPYASYPLSKAYGDLRKYQGEVAVRKFPDYAAHPLTDQTTV